ncbi:MAG TPA: response regulator transcription factor [Ignavibacteria bacterium]|nr:DNA-binding response regulator [Bacteroidota bacterium]HRF66854.1 response regulator transcription factor [Ignavibacteria bacterium]HRJ03777.1 response regulator transcription factor [Ignavibacteria bacterium]
MINILIADDHAVVRRGIKQILSDENDMQVLGEASNNEELISQLGDQPWDLIILDITMPGKSGLDSIIEIKQKKPDTKILILSMHPEEEIAISAIKSGADGYLNKESVPGELLRAVRKVASGGKYISSTLAESMIMSLQSDPARKPHESLSEREFQVLCMLASGSTLTEIAGKLELSIKTISTYRTRILEKMQLKSNVEITHYAIKNKLVLSS